MHHKLQKNEVQSLAHSNSFMRNPYVSNISDDFRVTHRDNNTATVQLRQMQRNQQETPSAPWSRPNHTGIPNPLKQEFEQKSGFSFDDVHVQYNSDKPEQLQALAYTQGSEIHIAPGQEQHLRHELGHVVQQKQGVVPPTGTRNHQPLNTNPALERAADKIAQPPPLQRAENTAAAPLQCKAAADAAIQLKTTCTIHANDGSQVTGESSNGAGTKSLMQQWPTVFEKFNQLSSKEMPSSDSDDTYTRTPFMCAEPNALAKLLNQHAVDAEHPVTKDWMKHLTLDDAIDGKTNAPIPPCAVCQQWVGGASPSFNLKDTVIPSEPIQSKYQEQADEDAARQQQQEAILLDNVSRYLENGFEQGCTFDRSGSIEIGLRTFILDNGNLISDATGLLPAHNSAWHDIIHKNNAPVFVAAADSLWADLLMAKSAYLNKERTLNAAKTKISELLATYKQQCTTANTEKKTLAIQFIKDNQAFLDEEVDHVRGDMIFSPITLGSYAEEPISSITMYEDGRIAVDFECGDYVVYP